MNTLLEKAKVAQKNSYSPYSKFKVGAAVIGNSGAIYTGCNVENASYGLTLCAERVAIFNAISNGETSISEIAITCTGNNADDNPPSLMPCGSCRQVMTEFCEDNTIIHIDGFDSVRLKDLLPNPFKL
jgi:cytidine deaminase